MRKRKWGCVTVLLLAGLVCCAGPIAAVMSVSAGLGGATSAVPVGAVSGKAAGIGERMMAAYQKAALQVTEVVPKCRGMRWPVLAGVARIESHHAAGHSIAAGGQITPRIMGPRLDGSGAGGNTTAFTDTDNGRWDGDTAYDRAVGPFQFLPSTFGSYGRDANGDRRVDPHNADDAALAAAVYLCGKGRDLSKVGHLRKALYAYNRSTVYVDDVMSWIDQYDAVTPTDGGMGSATGGARTVVKAALSQVGVPYSWGGGNSDGPSRGTCCSPGGQNGGAVVGFDCSGLTSFAFARAGVRLPRTAAAQAGVGRRIPAAAGFSALRPGDLVFYGDLPTKNSTIHHVGIYLGNGKMINAPRPGKAVRIDPVSSMPDYAGGARIL